MGIRTLLLHFYSNVSFQILFFELLCMNWIKKQQVGPPPLRAAPRGRAAATMATRLGSPFHAVLP
ncbi:Phosphatidylglycerol--prolipoprotein diacylglyceryl transferase [Frankliniella fusca]|uniref:Phosphatidylglycerol--prolipoprotein diacylglyceryl transferase n=1 Tax=Frankliniella fusca TaxID=407009 RepID=A0AAE1HF80_9NEOP|nr:Phosphatidylglycerol--prolipoprotein diacylglyceryl transferase [Frankliniella fusca]